MKLFTVSKMLFIIMAFTSVNVLATTETFTSDPSDLAFFIPLQQSTSGDYGKGTIGCRDGSTRAVGTCSDKVYLKPTETSNGWVNLDLNFGIPSSGIITAATLFVDFYDLDLLPYDLGNNGWTKLNFKETAKLSYLDKDGNVIANIAKLDKTYATSHKDVHDHDIVDTNNRKLNLSFALDPTKMFTHRVNGVNTFSVRLMMEAWLINNNHNTSFWIHNTKETVTAHMSYKTQGSKSTPVPEPSTLFLFIAAMVMILSMRKRQQYS